MTDTPSKLVKGLQRSWLLKFVWIWAPFVPLTAVAILNHYEGAVPEIVYALPVLAIFGALGLQYGFVTRRRRRTLARSLSPLQRLQTSHELDPVPLGEFLLVTKQPPIDTVPRAIQAMIARWGAPPSKKTENITNAVSLSVWIMFCAVAGLRDPFGFLSRHLGIPTIPYWPVFTTLFVLALLLFLRAQLRKMNDHYVAEAKASRRRPFPAL
ncbi:hypothetical protein QE419_000817 [Brevundimonas vesicularis]|uniref:hypothetical protein n=1 Tax=Brevundimonas vesicularis TaxID=41276 RepID=UPI0027866F36|nr:hypothetical protein [Brevundimonas vesicularis]MDQ1192051.1 hypothetical protein [Brevundimonas vesicularis]